MAARTYIAGAVLDFLQETRNADLHKFVEVVGRDGQEFHAFKQWVTAILRFFKYALVEGHPLHMAVEVKSGFVERNAGHSCSQSGG